MSDLAQEVRRLAPWYHTFELPGGVVTDGYFDLRGVAGRLPLPASLAGKRCLDAAACEGLVLRDGPPRSSVSIFPTRATRIGRGLVPGPFVPRKVSN
jgi:hypothetical protein